MREYCCHFLNEHGHSLFPADIRANGLDEAKQHCFSIMEESAFSLPMPPRAIEIWQDDVLLFRS